MAGPRCGSVGSEGEVKEVGEEKVARCYQPDEEASGGNSPDGRLCNLPDFIATVDDDASPPLAAQPGGYVPQRSDIRARDGLRP